MTFSSQADWPAPADVLPVVPVNYAPTQVLIVDDDPALRTVLHSRLLDEGFELHEAPDGRNALTRGRAVPYDLVLLDGMLPGIDGLVLCRAFRSEGVNQRTPILMISARDSEADRVLGLESGADDYLPKPFGFDELLARMRALMRRAGSPATAAAGRPSSYEVGGVVIDPRKRTVTVGGRPVTLTRQEFDLLELLTSRPGVVFSRDAIIERVWNGDRSVNARTIDSVVSRLRGKIEPDSKAPTLILREWGIGYRFVDAS